MKKQFHQGFGTHCVHAGHEPDPNFAHLTPIYASSTFVFDTAEQGMNRFSGKEKGYIYTRWGNPNFTEAEQKIAALETYQLHDGAGNALQAKAILHASGMAALTTLFLSELHAGDKIITHLSLYGGTDELLQKILPGLGVEAIIMDMHDLQQVEDILKTEKHIRMMYLETPANPTLRCVDLEACIKLAKQYQLTTAVDNTFATPYLQQPFRYGADYVFHSTTKFLNGHGTAVGGALVGRDVEKMQQHVTKIARLLGGNSNAFDAYLLTMGMKTLELRMQRHCDNAMRIATFLEQHPAVSRVNYPGLTSHPDYAIARKQMKHPGAILSFELKDGLPAGKKFIDRLQLCVRAVSLGTCDTLVCHPASMTHYGVPREQREKSGITDGLIRMSVGIENIEDLLADLQQALS
ncbi:MAG: aminotransferase class I/II-fold pyridoxal phosphate-dependent enzyme [Thermoflavifilum sp.]|uniref:trans-sulfuration enzyme family protein n=1 Tax=Thermoflavifilum sp. TaxID=1968839 RepID=UPI0018A65810|nr:aminotransferase class I/II-fold pyridoxal phosphate-dependent enzyme [Thermoflavifilum sp.]QOR75182.1 MAG: aminotransferase class I/II-fold pyridoxal phosphate-dependent enzyme [Thermoflavifilum sp.]